MSYDVWLEADLGGAEPVSVGNLEANYTYNVRPMFDKAIGEGPRSWDRQNAAHVARKLEMVLAAFSAERDAFLLLNPPNGWGDLDGCTLFVQRILDACRQAPQAIVRVG